MSNSIIRQAQGLASRWCLSIEIRRLCQSCDSSPVPGLAPLIVPTGIMDSDSETHNQQEVQVKSSFLVCSVFYLLSQSALVPGSI